MQTDGQTMLCCAVSERGAEIVCSEHGNENDVENKEKNMKSLSFIM